MNRDGQLIRRQGQVDSTEESPNRNDQIPSICLIIFASLLRDSVPIDKNV